jgi:sugar lactone lactonase YvrE
MFTSRENSKRSSQQIVRTIMLGTLLLALPIGMFGDKKKTDATPKIPKRVGVDIRKLIWPQPPAPTRLRYLDIYSGEKIDWAKIYGANKNRQKMTWKDRLAGTDPTKGTDQERIKLPFQLLVPLGLTSDSKGNFYIADAGVGAIFVYNVEQKRTELIKNGDVMNMGEIVGLAMDDNDQLFVSDAKFKQVSVLAKKNNVWERVDILGKGDLISPAGVAIDRENRLLYVVDTQADQVLVYDADSFKLLRKIGTTGKKHTLTDAGNFSLPTHAAVDKDGNLYVTDTLNARVEVFDADGQFIREFGKPGDGLGQFSKPKGIAIDCDGHVWVADEMLNRVQVLTNEGQPLMWFGKEGTLPGQFEGVYDITIDSKDRVITTEQFPARTQIFQYVNDAAAAGEQKQKEQEREQRAQQRGQKAAAQAPVQPAEGTSPK